MMGHTLLSEFLVEWFGNEGRELGDPSRHYTEDPKDLVEFTLTSKGPVFMSTNYYKGPDQVSKLDRLFYDFDSPDLDQAWRDAHDFAQRLKKFYNVTPLLTFSGRKGYHAHVFLQSPLGWELSQKHLKDLYNRLQLMLLGHSDRYETLDKAVLGDMKRLARVPYSLHEKSGEFCVPMDMKRRPVTLTPGFKAVYREHGLPLQLVEKAVKQVNDEIFQRSRPKRRSPRQYEKGLIHIRPCIEASLNGVSLDHKIRVAAVAELHAKGWGPHRIVQAFSSLSDFDQRKTEYFVKHAIRKGYSPFRCDTIQTLGGCLGSSCPIYRRRRS